ncbi:MAG: hypothetical protein AAFX87_24480 [Bacteroidota bacterium]
MGTKLNIFPKFKKRSVLLIMTLLVVLLIFAIYFFGYVRINEQKMIDRGFRVINRLALNISNKEAGYAQYLNYFLESIGDSTLKSIKEEVLSGDSAELAVLTSKLDAVKKEIDQNTNRYASRRLSSEERSLNRKISRLKQLRTQKSDAKLKEALEQKSQNIPFKPHIVAISNRLGNFQQYIDAEPEYLFFQNTFIVQDTVVLKDTVTAKDKIYHVLMKEELADFLSSIFSDDDFFDEFIMIKNEQIAFQTFKNHITLENADSLIVESKGISSGGAIDIALHHKAYKLILHKVEHDKLDDFYVGGFMEADKFNRQVRQVESVFIIITILALLLLIIIMPTLKLLLMSSIERLYIRNVVMIAGSIVIGTPILLLIIFCIYHFLIVENDQIDNRLENLSNQVSDSLDCEFRDIILEMEAHLDATNSAAAFESVPKRKYAYYNQLMLLDTVGNIVGFKSTIPGQKPNIPLGERQYFKRINEGDYWQININGNTKPVFLESIISWSDLTEEAAISIPSNNPKYPVIAMATRLNSIMAPVLPAGYGFAIIRSDGEVMFHSNAKKNLRENFIDETDRDPIIRSSTYSRTAAYTSFKYLNANHRGYVRPVNELPIFLITFYNKGYRNSRISEIMTLSLLLLLGCFTAVGLMILVLYFLKYRQSKLKVKEFLFNWVNPFRSKGDYDKLAFKFVLIFIVLNFFCLTLFSISDKLFVFVVTNAFLMVISHYQLNSNREKKDEKTEESKIWAKIGKDRFYVIFMVCVVLVNILHGVFLGIIELGKVLLYQLISLYLLYISDWLFGEYQNRKKKLLEAFASFRNKSSEDSKAGQTNIDTVSAANKNPDEELGSEASAQNEQKSSVPTETVVFKVPVFKNFIFIWLIISSVVPMFYIFHAMLDKENEIWTKYDQLSIARSLESKIDELSDQFEVTTPELVSKKVNSGNYLLKASFYNVDRIEIDSLHFESFDSLLFYLRPNYDNLIIQSKGLVYDSAVDATRKWQYAQNHNQLLFDYKLGKGLKFNHSDHILLSSKVNKSSPFSTRPSIVFTTVLFIIFIVFAGYLSSKAIEFTTRKIFAVEFSMLKGSKGALYQSNVVTIASMSKNVFVLGLPKSGKSGLIEELKAKWKALYTRKKIKICEINVLEINSEEQWNKAIKKASEDTYDKVIVENFEYQFNDHEANEKRLQLLESLLANGGGQIIVNSEIHPQMIGGFYEEKLRDENEAEHHFKYKSARNIWRHIFNGFTIVYNPMKPAEEIKLGTKLKDIDKWQKFLCKEIGFGTYLPDLVHLLENYISSLKLKFTEANKEDVVLKIQEAAETYYFGLWSTLSKSERYIIYDLAKDRFANINNGHGIKSLLEKGLLIYDNGLKIMNESFTNFVLTVVDKQEALLMEKEVREKGTWSQVSMILFIIVISAVVFIFFGNPDLFSDFNALLGVFAAVMGLLPRLNNLLNFGNINRSEPLA